MGFTPDAEYPVIHGEKGIINATCSREFTQSGKLRLISIEGGTASNVVPNYAKAELVCCREDAEKIAAVTMEKIAFTITDSGLLVESFGENAHGSTPWLGENAIGRLVLALNSMPFEGELADILSFLSKKLGMDTIGKAAGIHLQDEPSGNMSFNWGVLNATETNMSLIVNYRYPVTFSFADCGPAFQMMFENQGFTVQQVHKEKLYIPADSALVKTLLKVYKEHTGIDGQPVCIGGGTYAKSLPNILAFGPIFPGDEVREHKPDEFIEIPKLMKNAQIIAAAMYEMAK
jgi:succinyl-diaminopimelate desuccinylase